MTLCYLRFRARDYLDVKEAKRLARFSQMAVIAAQMALDDAGLELSDEEKEDVGVVQGTAVGGTVIEVEDGLRRLGPKSLMRISPNHLLALPPNMASFHIAKTFGFHGYCNTTVTACAAGAQVRIPTVEGGGAALQASVRDSSPFGWHGQASACPWSLPGTTGKQVCPCHPGERCAHPRTAV